MLKSALKMVIKNRKVDSTAQWLFEMITKHENFNIRDMAKECYMSNASITRYFKRHGFTGFKEFKTSLIKETELFEKVRDDELFLHELFLKPITETNKLNTQENYMEIIKMLFAADQIIIQAVGDNVSAAHELRIRLTRFGLRSNYEPDFHVGCLSVINLTNTSVCVALSYSGETKEVIDIVNLAKKRGAKVIAFVADKNSTLYRLADKRILLNSENDFLSIFSIKSKISMMFAILKLVSLIIIKCAKKYNQT